MKQQLKGDEMETQETVKLWNGREVAAKYYCGQFVPLTYANRKQAQEKQKILGDLWEVCRYTRPFYVVKVIQ